MRFETLNLEKYGSFSDRVLKFREDASLHIVFGANEAGKSTALAAIADLLFGFPHTSNFDFLHDGRALRIGANLRLRDGSSLAFRRRKGRANTIVDAMDKPLGDDLLAPVIGSVTRESFLRDFGLNALALREGGEAILAADGNLAETLAAGSAGLSALNRLKAKLSQEADERFTLRRAGSKPFYEALDRYNNADKALRAAIVTGDALKRAQEARDAAALAHKDKTEAHREASRTLARLERAQRTCAKLRLLGEAEAALRSLAHIPQTGADTIERWTEAFVNSQKLAAQEEETRKNIADFERQIAELKARPELLVEAGAIEKLRENLGAALKALDDLPKRLEASRIAHAALENAAQQLGLASADVLVERMPTEIALAQVRALVREKSDLVLRRKVAQERLAKARQRCEDCERRAPHEQPADPAGLLQDFDGFATIPSDARELQRLRAELEEASVSLEAQAARLNPPAGSVEQLLKTALPDASFIESAVQIWKECAEAIRAAERDFASVAKAIAETQASLAELSVGGAVATHEEWRAAQQARDSILGALDTSLAAPEPERLVLLMRLRQATDAADRIAEKLLGDANRAARKQSLLLDIEKLRVQESEAKARVEAANATQAQAYLNWKEGWIASGIAPLKPESMQNWFVQAQRIIEQHGKLARDRAAASAISARLASVRQSLSGFLPRLGLKDDAGQSVDALHAQAHRTLARIQKEWHATRELALELQSAVRDIDSAEKDIAGIDMQDNAMRERWESGMRALSLPNSAGPSEAAAALEIWAKATLDHRQYRDDRHRAEAIRADVEAFDARVNSLAARFCGDLAGEGSRQLVDALSQRLEEARRGGQEAGRLAGDLANARRGLAALQEARAAAQAICAEAALAMGVASEDIGDALKQAQDVLQHEADAAQFRRDLIDSADGLDVVALRAEQEGLDFDALAGEIARQKASVDLLMGEITQAAIAANAAAKDYDQLCEGRNAAALAQEREEAAGELLDVSREWIIRAAAARLAGFAIERHRQGAQDPVLSSISGYFAIATAGAFRGIGLEYGDEDQPVFRAVRANGDAVAISGLSEGTRDQLFLSLRLALLAQRSAEPLPFVGDDLLTSFDDARAAQSLDLLTAFGAGRQTILFTHHRHVADIAAKQLGDRLDLIELGG